jgi:ammonium transporter Rh
VLSISSSVVFSVLVSKIAHGKLDMEIILNASLAGGVSMGSATDLIVEPFASLIIGAGAGTVSALGYAYIGPFLNEKIGLHDTCGVHNLHGMPGIMGGVIGSISSSTVNYYGHILNPTFAAIADGSRNASQ